MANTGDPLVQTTEPRAPSMLQDLRYALRTFARSPALVAAAVVCLALGIGANATIFGVVDTLLFRPPPHVQDPERVVRLYFRRRLPPFGTTTSSITGYPLYTLIRESARSFDALAAYTYSQSASLGRGVDARRVRVVLASASYFPLLGVRSAVGRFYSADEDRLGGPPVVVLGYGFWRAAFQGDSGILGRQLQLGRGSYTVVGGAPERLTGVNLENVDAWVPLTGAATELMGPGALNRGADFLELIRPLRRRGRGGPASSRSPARDRERAARARGGMRSAAGVTVGRSRDSRFSAPRHTGRRVGGGWPRAAVHRRGGPAHGIPRRLCAGAPSRPSGPDAGAQSGRPRGSLSPIAAALGAARWPSGVDRHADRGRRAVRAQPE